MCIPSCIIWIDEARLEEKVGAHMYTQKWRVSGGKVCGLMGWDYIFKSVAKTALPCILRDAVVFACKAVVHNNASALLYYYWALGNEKGGDGWWVESYVDWLFCCFLYYRSDYPVALSEWHRILISRTSRLISMRIDNQSPLMALTPGAFTQVRFHPLSCFSLCIHL